MLLVAKKQQLLVVVTVVLVIIIYILILIRPRIDFSRISSAYLVVSTSEWYACDQLQRAKLLRVVPFHTENCTKTATADKHNQSNRKWQKSALKRVFNCMTGFPTKTAALLPVDYPLLPSAVTS